jgi:hypothetical protein
MSVRLYLLADMPTLASGLRGLLQHARGAMLTEGRGAVPNRPTHRWAARQRTFQTCSCTATFSRHLCAHPLCCSQGVVFAVTKRAVAVQTFRASYNALAAVAVSLLSSV